MHFTRDSTANRIATAVRRERIRQGLTQTELALAAGVGKRLIHEIETEKPTARLDTIEQVLAALGLSLRVVRRRDVQAADEEEPPARQRVRRH